MVKRQDDYKPTRTHAGQDIGGGKSHKSGYGYLGNDLSSKIEQQQRRGCRSDEQTPKGKASKHQDYSKINRAALKRGGKGGW